MSIEKEGNFIPSIISLRSGPALMLRLGQVEDISTPGGNIHCHGILLRIPYIL